MRGGAVLREKSHGKVRMQEADLEGVIGALGFRVHLHVEGLHEVQGNSEAVLQADAVGAAGEFGVWLRVLRATEIPRPLSEHLA